MGQQALVAILVISFLATPAFSGIPATFALCVNRVLFLPDAWMELYVGLRLIFLPGFVHYLGLSEERSRFFPGVPVAILIGISFALFLELFRERTEIGGLGLGGAVVINLGGGGVDAGRP